MLQRVGRANHRMDEASRAFLVPANRFEVLECEAAMLGVAAGELDGEAPRAGGLDVLAQHLLGMACAAPFTSDEMYEEVRRAAPYARLSRTDFDDVLRCSATVAQWEPQFPFAQADVQRAELGRHSQKGGTGWSS